MLHRRLAELKEQLRDARAEQKADAAAYASTLESQQVGSQSMITLKPYCRPGKSSAPNSMQGQHVGQCVAGIRRSRPERLRQTAKK